MKRSLNRNFFVVIIILGVSLGGYLLYRHQNPENFSSATQNTSPPENFFQKPGDLNNYSPAPSPSSAKTTVELEEVVKSSENTPADYNSLAMAYYKQNKVDKALQVIDEGLLKYPNDNSLLLTKDLIENILPKL